MRSDLDLRVQENLQLSIPKRSFIFFDDNLRTMRTMSLHFREIAAQQQVSNCLNSDSPTQVVQFYPWRCPSNCNYCCICQMAQKGAGLHQKSTNQQIQEHVRVDCYHKVSQNYENHLLYCHYSMLLHQSRIFFYWQNVSSRTFVKILAEGVMTFVKISSLTTLPSSFLPPHNHLATHVSSHKDEFFPDGNLGLTPPSIVRYRYTNSCQPLPFSQ